ncbi:MAG: HAD family hydrolase [Candidatus Methylarchaceae archaeon HK02M1]|nr:HAD family hydrolase [Candidatus Methylarchaceae archaeon HK02M1]
MKVRVVLFDLDGTLVYLKFKYAESRIAIIEFLKRLGFDASKIFLRDNAQTILEKVEEQIREKSMNVKLSEIKNRIWFIIDDFEIDAVRLSELAEGSKTILSFLSEKGIKVGMVTNSGRKATQLALKKHDLEHAFDVTVTRDEVNRLKPYGEGIGLALRILNVPTTDAIYIGDSFNDFLAAKDVGVRFIMVNRFHSAEGLKQASPDYAVNFLSESIELINQFIKN